MTARAPIDRIRPWAPLVLIVLFCWTGCPAAWAEEPGEDLLGLSGEGPIQVTADELVADSRNRTAEFVGNVEAVQGEVVIRSKRLKIRYSDSGGGTGEGIEGKIDTITASGDVRIRFGERTAEAETAEYRVVEGVLVLSGEGARILEGGNSITGRRITLYRDDERITVEGGEKQRVRAIFLPSSRKKE